MRLLPHSLLTIAVIALGAATTSARADMIDPTNTYDLSATARGWVINASDNNNGASAGNNFFSGYTNARHASFRNWFEFVIPDLTGESLTSATLEIDDLLHLGGSLTYSVYGLGSRPLMFTDVTTVNPFGAFATSFTSSGTTLSITLNAAALEAITAQQGGDIFIGGIESGEGASSENYDFGFSGGYNKTSLVLTAAPSAVPEPTAVIMLGTVVAILAGTRRRRRSS